jgi:hypothetical protein
MCIWSFVLFLTNANKSCLSDLIIIAFKKMTSKEPSEAIRVNPYYAINYFKKEVQPSRAVQTADGLFVTVDSINLIKPGD